MRVEFDHLHVPVAVSGQRDRPGERAHPLDRGIDLGRIADQEGQPAAGGRDVADVDARIAAKLGRDRIFHRREALLLRVARIRFEQQVAAAGKVEAEVILYCGSHFGH